MNCKSCGQARCSCELVAAKVALAGAAERARSTVNAPLPRADTHYCASVAESAHGLCGHPILANNWTSVDTDVTCGDCLLRILAVLQQRQNALLVKLAELVAKRAKS